MPILVCMSLTNPVPKSFYYAFEGFKTAVKEEPNFRIHLTIATIALILATVLGFALTEWLVLLFTISLVLILELVNTSMEEIVNLVNPETHPLAKKAKDVMAAAVLLSAFIAIIIGFVLFLPKLILL